MRITRSRWSLGRQPAARLVARVLCVSRFSGFNGFSPLYYSALLAFSFHSGGAKSLSSPVCGLLQTVVAVALFFVASLNSFTGSG